jgi:hypothetical protein
LNYFGSGPFGQYWLNTAEDAVDPTATLIFSMSLAGTQDDDPTATLEITMSLSGEGGISKLIATSKEHVAAYNPPTKEHRV